MKRQYVLEHLIRKNNYASMVELGLWKGQTVKHILSVYPNMNYIGVDLYMPQPNAKGETYMPNENNHKWDHEVYAEQMVNLVYKYSNFEFKRMDTVEAANDIEDESIDILFIDAQHTYDAVLADIQAWYPKIRKGGMITGHDYNEKLFPGVIQAVNETFPQNKIELFDDTVWVVRK